MAWESGGDLPDGRWILSREAADIWSRASGSHVSDHRFREWVKHSDPRLEDVGKWHIGDRYYVDLDDILNLFELRAKRSLEVVHEERAKARDK